MGLAKRIDSKGVPSTERPIPLKFYVLLKVRKMRIINDRILQVTRLEGRKYHNLQLCGSVFDVNVSRRNIVIQPLESKMVPSN